MITELIKVIGVFRDVRHGILLIIMLLTVPGLRGQQMDSIMQWSTFRREVLTKHPLARRADISVAQADAALLRARGGFDPKLYADHTQKDFKGSEYFNYTEGGIKLPTWLGLELKGNYNWTSGVFLNPESTLPGQGQANLGVNWTLGQGLFIDDRRASLQQARIGLGQGQAERDLLQNQLMFEGAKVYWEWVLARNQLAVFEDALEQAEIRFEGIKESYIQGDFPAIDTLETFIQVQNRMLDVNFARLEAQNAEIALNNFMWNEDGQPLEREELPDSPEMRLAEPIQASPLDTILNNISNHPQLRMYEAKLGILEVEQRLKKEKRKPVLDVNYNLLGNGWQFFSTSGIEGPAVLANDVKWGLNFSYPIPNRKARGDYQVTTMKIAQTTFDLQQKRIDIQNKVRSYANELDNLQKQIELYQSITDNYLRLLEGENEKFRFGESSVFLINSREQKWLEAQIKLLKLQSQFEKAKAGMLWAAGTLNI